MPAARLLTVLAALALGATATLAEAQPTGTAWRGGTSSSWNVGSNWRSGQVPRSDQVADLGTSNEVQTTVVSLDQSATVFRLLVANPFTTPLPFPFGYTLQRTNNSVLTATGITRLSHQDGVPSLVTFNGFHLDTGELSLADSVNLQLLNNARVATNGAVTLFETSVLNITSGSLAVNDGDLKLFNASTLNVNGGSLAMTNGSLMMSSTGVVNITSGSLQLAPGRTHEIAGGTINVNGGALVLGDQSGLDMSGATSRLNFTGGFNVTNNSAITVRQDSDIVGNSYVDVGNGGIGELLLSDVGTTLTAGNVSDWGRGEFSYALVSFTKGATGTVDDLRLGTDNAEAGLLIRDILTSLTVTGDLTAGGGATDRPVILSVDSSARLTVNGVARFNNKASLRQNDASLTFNDDVFFNEGSELQRTGGPLVIASGKKLIVNGGVINDTDTTGEVLSEGAGVEVRGLTGRYNVVNFLDIRNGSLLVESFGQYNSPDNASTTDWGQPASTSMTATVRSEGRINVGDLRIADQGAATVNVESQGRLNTRNLSVGGESTSAAAINVNNGLVTVLGNANLRQGTVLTLNDPAATGSGQATFVTVGGDLNLQGNARITTLGSDPGINVNGFLSVGAGSSIEFNSASSFGVGKSATINGGSVNLSGTAVMEVAENLTVGVVGGGAGTLTVNPGTRLNVGDSAFAIADNNYSYVEDSSSGATDGGTLSVRNGATLTNSNFGLSVGEGPGKFGRIVVSGTGSTVNDTVTYLGWQGAGALEVGAGGRFATSEMFLGSNGGVASVVVAGAGSRLEVVGGINVGGTGSTNGSVLQVTSGARVTATQVNVRAGSLLNVTGGGQVAANADNRGELSIYNSSVTGGVTLRDGSQMLVDNATVGALQQQAGAELLLSLRSLSDFDNLHVLGPAILAGDLSVTLGLGYSPRSGDSFRFLTSAGEVNENFGSLNLPTLSAGLEWQLDASVQFLTLSVTGDLDGDYNSDGVVNAADYTVWRDGLGSTFTAADYDVWRNNYGAPGESTALANSTSVPEPSAAALLLALASTATLRRRNVTH